MWSPAGAAAAGLPSFASYRWRSDVVVKGDAATPVAMLMWHQVGTVGCHKRLAPRWHVQLVRRRRPAGADEVGGGAREAERVEPLALMCTKAEAHP